MCVATAILCFDECCLLLHWTNNVCVCAKINTNLNDNVDAFWAGPSWPNGRGMPEQLTALQSKRQTFQPLRLTLAGTLLSTETRCLPPLIQTPLTLCLSFFLFFFSPLQSSHYDNLYFVRGRLPMKSREKDHMWAGLQSTEPRSQRRWTHTPAATQGGVFAVCWKCSF